MGLGLVTTRDGALAALVAIASDSHKLMREADDAIKGHTRNRFEAVVRLHRDHGADSERIAVLTGIPEPTVRHILFKFKTIGFGKEQP